MLQINYVAEEIITRMFSESIAVRDLFARQKPQLQKVIAKSVAHAEIKLHLCNEYKFDGAHSIDVGFVNSERTMVVPCELKLGLDRLSSTVFGARFMEKCKISAHKDKRIAGNMIAVLDGMLPDICKGHQITALLKDKTLLLQKEWYLVLRKSVLLGWKRTSYPAFSERCTAIPFEDMVESFGSPSNFNSLVSDILHFDYFKEWLGTF